MGAARRCGAAFGVTGLMACRVEARGVDWTTGFLVALGWLVIGL